MISLSITLPDTASHQLTAAFIAANLTAGSSTIVPVVFEFSELVLLNDPLSGANSINVGGSDVTNTVYSYQLPAGGSILYRRERGRQLYYLRELWVKAISGTPILHIEGKV